MTVDRQRGADNPDAVWWRWALVAILLLAFGLRVYGLGSGSLWYDETVSVHLAGKSLPDLVAHTAGDIHPPGYYALLHLWQRLAGSSDFAVAFPSLFFGLLLVALAYHVGARIYGPTTGLMAALLVAISPFNLWYSQEVRMYTLGAALGMGLLVMLAPMLTSSSTPSQSWRRLAVYALLAALGLWVLYYFAFLLVAINLMVFAWWLSRFRGKRGGWGWLGRWLLAQGAVLLLYAAWLPIAWRQATNPPVPPWRSFTGLGDLLLQVGSSLSIGQAADPIKFWPVLLLYGVLFVFGLVYWGRREGEEGLSGANPASLFLTGYVFGPVLLIFAASFITPLFHVRYSFTYSTPFYILVGAGLAWLWQRWREAAWFSLAVIVIMSGYSIFAYHTDVRSASDDHRAGAGYLSEHWRPGDAILVNAGYAYTALNTYWMGDDIEWQGRLVGEPSWATGGTALQGPVVVQTGTVDGDPSLGWGDPDSDFYAMSRAETDEALLRLFDDFDRVWVYRIYDTVTDPNGHIRDWLQENGSQFEDRLFGGQSQLRVQGFLSGRDPLAAVAQVHDAVLADGSLQLLAASAEPLAVEVGQELDLTLVWQAAGEAAGQPILFAGLFDEQGQRWAQADERAAGTLLPAETWPAGATVRTPLRIRVPSNTPPGRYQLEVGWYRFVDGQATWLPWAAGDRHPLGQVEVLAPKRWADLPPSEVAYSSGVDIGPSVRLLGFDAPALAGQPGATLPLELVWQALEDTPQPGLAVLQLLDDTGAVVSESASAPVGGQAPFASLAGRQTIRDPRSLELPGELEPGIYTLLLGRRWQEGWLPVRRGPVALGDTYPLATIQVEGRPANYVPPRARNAIDARFGETIRLIGYDLEADGQRLGLSLHWQVLASTPANYKIFAHLVGAGGPSDIRTQADLHPRLPTSGWLPGEYLSDELSLDLPPGLDPAGLTLLVGLYDEGTGQRLIVVDADGEPLGDSLPLPVHELGP